MKAVIHQQRAKMQLTGILVISVLLLCLFGLLLPALPSSPMMRDSFWAHKIDAEPVYDIVFTGDSRVYRGIDPAVFEHACAGDIKAFNYGFSSAGLDSLLLGRASRLLKADGRKILVIGVSVNSFLPESIQNNHIKSLLHWNDQDLWIKKNLYPALSCFDPYTIANLYKISKGERYEETYHVNNGFAASEKTPLDSGLALEAYRHQFEQQKVIKSAEEGFTQYIKTLRVNGIKVILLRIPSTQAMKELEDASTDNGLYALRKELASDGFLWIDPAGNYISYDGSHLNTQSAELLSTELVHKINLCADK